MHTSQLKAHIHTEYMKDNPSCVRYRLVDVRVLKLYRSLMKTTAILDFNNFFLIQTAQLRQMYTYKVYYYYVTQ